MPPSTAACQESSAKENCRCGPSPLSLPSQRGKKSESLIEEKEKEGREDDEEDSEKSGAKIISSKRRAFKGASREVWLAE